MELTWPVPSEFPALSADEVHLWAVPLDASRHSATGVAAVLSLDEQARAACFVVDKPRQAFAIGRLALRSILGRYLEIAPRDVAIANDANGKPQLASGDLRFNLAHSGDLAVIAIACGCEIGVDLERMRPVERAHEIAGRNFHLAERAAIDAAVPTERSRMFMRCWTRKEAVLKAIGTGLNYPLDAFDVLTPNDQRCVTIPADGSLPAVRCWWYDAEPCSEYLAAVATLEPRRRPLGFTYWL